MFFIVDAAFEAYRAHNVFRRFTSSSGTPNGVLFGFLRALNSFRKLFGGPVGVAWEGKPKSRQDCSSDYKSGRRGIPPPVVSQLKPLQDMLRCMGVVQFQHPDWEADDLMATVASKVFNMGESVVIVTGDDDLLQVVEDNANHSICVFNPRCKVLYHEKEVVGKYGVPPCRLSDLWAIQGDASDGIVGVKGIGDKFSVELVTRYGDVKSLYFHLSELNPESLPPKGKKLTEFKRLVRLLRAQECVLKNKYLLTLNCDVPDMIIDEPVKDMAHLKDLFKEHSLNSFLKNFDEWGLF